MHSRVLVTGASGFIGLPLCRRLVQQGWLVRAGLRSEDKAGVLPTGVEPVVVGDLAARMDWGQALEGVQVVVHLAALVHQMGTSSPDLRTRYRNINTLATVSLAEAAARAGVRRFIFMSTIKVNGEYTGAAPFTEDDPPAPADHYARSKWEAEKGLRHIGERSGMEWVALRPPLVYGPAVGANFLKLLRWVDRGLPLPFRMTDNRRSLISELNLTDAVLCAATHPAAANQVFLCSDGEALSTSQLVVKIANALGKPARLFPMPKTALLCLAGVMRQQAAVQRLTASLEVSGSKLRRLLEWHPPEIVDQGIARTVEWYRAYAGA